GADPAVVGREIVLGGRRHSIIRVLPERVLFAVNPFDIWRPLPIAPGQARGGYRVHAVARLAHAASAAAVAAALHAGGRASSPPARTISTPVATAIAGDSATTLRLLILAAALALVIAFTNLAGLLIVRSIDRRRELAVRSALGARQWEITKQLLLEALALV